jgi:Na+/glutamate symporter
MIADILDFILSILLVFTAFTITLSMINNYGIPFVRYLVLMTMLFATYKICLKRLTKKDLRD